MTFDHMYTMMLNECEDIGIEPLSMEQFSLYYDNNLSMEAILDTCNDVDMGSNFYDLLTYHVEQHEKNQ